MHLAICSVLEKNLPIKDANSFKVGHILPDSVFKIAKIEVNSHFVKSIDDGRRKYFDFIEFYDTYKEYVLTDDLFLGYYFHLIQDNLFRRFLYSDLGLLFKRGEEGFLENLYRDYHILNGLLVKKYSLKADMYVPDNFSHCAINDIYDFELAEDMETLQLQFKDNFSDTPVYLDENSADEFIYSAVKICEEEYKALCKGEHRFSEYDFAFYVK